MIRVLLLVALAALPASAQLRVDARLAWGGQGRPDTWTAVRVEIENAGSGMRVDVEIEGDGATTAQAIEAPGGSRQVHWLCVKPTRRMRVTARTGAAIVSETWLEPTLSRRGERLIAVAAGGIGGLPSKEGWVPIAVGEEDLPDVSDAWDTLDAVVVALPGPAIPEGSAEALKRWTRAGGTLVLMAGGEAPSLARGAFGGLLPARVTGVKELKSLREIDAGIPTPSTPFPVAAFERLAGAEERLGSVRGRAGLGRVVFVPFDATLRPVSDWGGLAKRWSEWLDLRRASLYGVPYRTMAEPREALAAYEGDRKKEREIRGRGRKVAGEVAAAGQRHLLGWIFALLAGFVLLGGPVDWFVLRKLGRQPWTWATWPGLIVTVCAAAWVFGVRDMPRTPRVTVTGVLDVWATGARETAWLTVVAPEGGEAEVRLGARDGRIWPADPDVAGETPDRGTRVSGGPVPTARGLRMEAWRPRVLLATADLPASAFRLEVAGTELRLHGPGVLRGAQWRVGGEPIPVGDIPPGGVVPRGPAGASPAFLPGSFAAAAAEFLRACESGVPEGPADLLDPSPEVPVLTGWLDVSPAAPTVNGAPASSTLLFVRIHSPVPR